VKPSFFQNDQLAELPFEARLLFIGLWCMADREGRLEDRPKRIKMHVFPADSIDVEPLLDGLAQQGLIERYEAHGVQCISIPRFVEHQRPHPNEQPSKLPTKVSNQGTKSVAPKLEADGLNPSSLNPECSLPRGREQVAHVVGLDLQAWNRFETYRREIRKPIKPASVQATQRKLAGFGADQAAVVEESVAQGWTGLFPLKRAIGEKPKLTWKPPPDEEEQPRA
jgi:hypothetical protein